MLLLSFITKHCLIQGHEDFSSKSFKVLGLTFMSVIHFEFIFACGVRVCSNFIDLHAAVQLSQTPLAGETVFSLLYIFASFVKD